MRRFVLDGNVRKVWNIYLSERSYTVRWGPVGDKRQVKTFECDSPEKARKEHDRKVQAKRAEGYVEVIPSPVQRALDAALAADPDDLVTHMAYADYLTEQGDPRGEFIRTQLALERPDLPTEERERLTQFERELYQKHGNEWLGAVAHYTRKRWTDRWTVRFRRGWLWEVNTNSVTPDGADALLWEPEARLLQRLHLGPAVSAKEWTRLAKAPSLGSVRCLQLGAYDFRPDLWPLFSPPDHGNAVWTLAQTMPNLEELHVEGNFAAEELFRSDTLAKLRVLHWRGGSHYPLELLANNKSFRSLTHLLLLPRALRRGPVHGDTGPILRRAHLRTILRSRAFAKVTHLQFRQSDIGDQDCRDLVASGILDRLKFLDLARGSITDVGARVLAKHPALPRLEGLDLSFNALTSVGLAALRETGVPLVAKYQHAPGETGHLHGDAVYADAEDS
jgi:uncharacterized protein (TIGR02996 family)